MVAGDMSAQLQTHTKLCRKCSTVKPAYEFSRASNKPDGLQCHCKSCSSNLRRAYEKTQQGIKTRLKCRAAARNRRKLALGYAGASKEQKRVYRAKQNGADPRIIDDVLKAGGLREFRKINTLCEQNAKQAWRHWINTLAPQWWIKKYTQKKHIGQPWQQDGLSEAEKFRLRYKHDPEFNLKQRIRAHIRREKKKDKIGDVMRTAIKTGGQSNTVHQLLGYTIEELKTHLERQFTKGMNWAKFNEGKIHIDHIVPISAFEFAEVGDDEWKRCWCLTNLRPMWAKDNLAKSAKRMYLI